MRLAIFTYSKADRLEQLLNSLNLCEAASEIDVVVSVDGGDNWITQKPESYDQMIQYGRYAFRKLSFVIREQRYGRELHANILMNEMFCDCEWFVMLEEDNIVSQDFITYVRSAVEAFGSDQSVFSISAFMYPEELLIQSQIPPGLTFVKAPLFGGYGVVRFRKHSISAYDATRKWITWVARRPHKYLFLRKTGGNLFSLLVRMELLDETYGDVAFSFYCIRNSLHNIFPTQTRVVNRGYDGRGENCGNDPRFQRQLLPEPSQLNRLDTSHVPVVELRPVPDSVKRELFFVFLYFLLFVGLKPLAKKIYLGALSLKKLVLS